MAPTIQPERASASAPCMAKASPLAIAPLGDSETSEVLAFLNETPKRTFMMSGLIRDNGLESPLNRGTFYGYRDPAGRLEGVSLIGEITMFEAHSDAAVAAFARRTQITPNLYMIIGEQQQVRRFWAEYAEAGQRMRLFCREMLFELRYPVEVHQPVTGLRQATLNELEQLMTVHAKMALEESGIDPLVADPQGFRQRCARRTEQGRTWIYAEGQRLIFKADVISQTPEIFYLEGVYVSPEERGRGNGVRCLSQLSRRLLTQTKSICVLVNEHNQAAQALYRQSRYQFCTYYDTIFL